MSDRHRIGQPVTIRPSLVHASSWSAVVVALEGQTPLHAHGYRERVPKGFVAVRPTMPGLGWSAGPVFVRREVVSSG